MAVQYYDIILKNTTASGITIRDLSGLYVPASGTRDVSDLFPFNRLVASEDLDPYITNSGITLNVEGADLTAAEAEIFLSHHNATHIQGIPIGSPGQEGPEQVAYSGPTVSGVVVLKYTPDENRVGMEELNFLDLADTPTTYSGVQPGYAARVNSAGTGVEFGPPTPGATFSGTIPPNPADSNIWYNESDNVLYYWDSERLKWLSVFTHNYLFTYGGAIDGAYMSIGNVTHDSAYYYMPRPACLVGITANAQPSQESNKSFTIWNEATSSGILDFQMSNWVYRSFTEDADMDEGAEVKCQVSSEGLAVRNPVVMMEVRWRYDPNA